MLRVVISVFKVLNTQSSHVCISRVRQGRKLKEEENPSATPFSWNFLLEWLHSNGTRDTSLFLFIKIEESVSGVQTQSTFSKRRGKIIYMKRRELKKQNKTKTHTCLSTETN